MNTDAETLRDKVKEKDLAELRDAVKNKTRPYIRVWPDPALSMTSIPFESSEFVTYKEEIDLLSQLMVNTVTATDALGLAGPQIGVLRRIIAVRLADGIETFINPKIVSKSEETEVGYEGCLSLPGVTEQITRSKTVTLEWRSADGEALNQKEFTALEARIIQHEVDHLNGFMFFVHLGRQRRRLLFRAYEARLARMMKKGDVRA